MSLSNSVFRPNVYPNSVRIGLMDPNIAQTWAERIVSDGTTVASIKKGDTINHTTSQPIATGLFCQRIFGPCIDYTCACGHEKIRIHVNVNVGPPICPECRVEWTEAAVRRQRLGLIKLISPVTHKWFSENQNYIPILTGIGVKSFKNLKDCKLFFPFSLPEREDKTLNLLRSSPETWVESPLATQAENFWANNPTPSTPSATDTERGIGLLPVPSGFAKDAEQVGLKDPHSLHLLRKSYGFRYSTLWAQPNSGGGRRVSGLRQRLASYARRGNYGPQGSLALNDTSVDPQSFEKSGILGKLRSQHSKPPTRAMSLLEYLVNTSSTVINKIENRKASRATVELSSEIESISGGLHRGLTDLTRTSQSPSGSSDGVPTFDSQVEERKGLASQINLEKISCFARQGKSYQNNKENSNFYFQISTSTILKQGWNTWLKNQPTVVAGPLKFMPRAEGALYFTSGRPSVTIGPSALGPSVYVEGPLATQAQGRRLKALASGMGLWPKEAPLGYKMKALVSGLGLDLRSTGFGPKALSRRSNSRPVSQKPTDSPFADYADRTSYFGWARGPTRFGASRLGQQLRALRLSGVWAIGRAPGLDLRSYHASMGQKEASSSVVLGPSAHTEHSLWPKSQEQEKAPIDLGQRPKPKGQKTHLNTPSNFDFAILNENQKVYIKTSNIFLDKLASKKKQKLDKLTGDIKNQVFKSDRTLKISQPNLKYIFLFGLNSFLPEPIKITNKYKKLRSKAEGLSPWIGPLTNRRLALFQVGLLRKLGPSVSIAGRPSVSAMEVESPKVEGPCSLKESLDLRSKEQVVVVPLFAPSSPIGARRAPSGLGPSALAQEQDQNFDPEGFQALSLRPKSLGLLRTTLRDHEGVRRGQKWQDEARSDKKGFEPFVPTQGTVGVTEQNIFNKGLNSLFFNRNGCVPVRPSFTQPEDYRRQFVKFMGNGVYIKNLDIPIARYRGTIFTKNNNPVESKITTKIFSPPASGRSSGLYQRRGPTALTWSKARPALGPSAWSDGPYLEQDKTRGPEGLLALSLRSLFADALSRKRGPKVVGQKPKPLEWASGPKTPLLAPVRHGTGLALGPKAHLKHRPKPLDWTYGPQTPCHAVPHRGKKGQEGAKRGTTSLVSQESKKEHNKEHGLQIDREPQAQALSASQKPHKKTYQKENHSHTFLAQVQSKPLWPSTLKSQSWAASRDEGSLRNPIPSKSLLGETPQPEGQRTDFFAHEIYFSETKSHAKEETVKKILSQTGGGGLQEFLERLNLEQLVFFLQNDIFEITPRLDESQSIKRVLLQIVNETLTELNQTVNLLKQVRTKKKLMSTTSSATNHKTSSLQPKTLDKKSLKKGFAPVECSVPFSPFGTQQDLRCVGPEGHPRALTPKAQEQQTTLTPTGRQVVLPNTQGSPKGSSDSTDLMFSKRSSLAFKIKTLEKKYKEIKKEYKVVKKICNDLQNRKSAYKRRFKLAFQLLRTTSNPTGLTLSSVPVLPPGLRPIIDVPKIGPITADLNIRYRGLIFALRNLRELAYIDFRNAGAAQASVQEAVEDLLYTGGKARSSLSPGPNLYKSLAMRLKGKHGRFRGNLLGKRVDYSGRSVIVVGPTLKIHQCGLPFEIAVKLFNPFLIRRLIQKGLCKNVYKAKQILLEGKFQPLIWALCREVMLEHLVLLNRAPTLHRLGVQAFMPILVSGRAILLHPLVCTGFNADFDGDQMGVHVPLFPQARVEAWKMMWSRNNFLSPSSGEPILLPSQDMVLGCYYLTESSLISNQKILRSYPSARGPKIQSEGLGQRPMPQRGVFGLGPKAWPFGPNAHSRGVGLWPTTEGLAPSGQRPSSWAFDSLGTQALVKRVGRWPKDALLLGRRPTWSTENIKALSLQGKKGRQGFCKHQEIFYKWWEATNSYLSKGKPVWPAISEPLLVNWGVRVAQINKRTVGVKGLGTNWDKGQLFNAALVSLRPQSDNLMSSPKDMIGTRKPNFRGQGVRTVYKDLKVIGSGKSVTSRLMPIPACSTISVKSVLDKYRRGLYNIQSIVWINLKKETKLFTTKSDKKTNLYDEQSENWSIHKIEGHPSFTTVLELRVTPFGASRLLQISGSKKSFLKKLILLPTQERIKPTFEMSSVRTTIGRILFNDVLKKLEIF